MKKLKWVVSGAAGLAGKKVIKDGLLASRNCELVGVHSRSKERAQVEGQKYAVPCFTSVEKMISKTGCDAIYIASPQYAHLEEIKISAKYKRHILCEKPLATNVRDAEQIVNICNKEGVSLAVDFNYRFHPLHQKMRQLIQEGAIGRVVSGRCQFGVDYPPVQDAFRQIIRLSGGGSFTDLGNHAVDLLEYVTDRRIKWVMAVKKNTIYRYETEDTCAALFEFQEGGIGIVDAYFCSPLLTLRNDLEINGSMGTIYTQNTLQMETTGNLILRTLRGKKTFKCPIQDMYQKVFEKVTDAILKDKNLPVLGEDGIHSQKIIEAVYQSSDTGRRIEID